MTPLLSLVLLVLLAFLGSFFYKKLKIDALWVKAIAYSGILYIALGYLIGPGLLELVTVSVSEELNVLFALVLSWAGFLVGIQTNIKGLKRFPRKYYFSVTINFIIIFFLLAVLLSVLVHYFQAPPLTMVDVALLSVVGALSSPIVLGVLIKDNRLDGRLSYRLQFSAALNNLLGIIAMEGVFLAAALMSGDMTAGWQAPLRFVFPLLIVLLSVFIYAIMYDVMKTRQEKFLLFISLLLVLVGLAYYFKQSILFTSFLFGAGLANIKISSTKLYQTVQELEKPLYVLLLIFTGLNLRILPGMQVYMFLILFIVLRVLVKVFSEGAVAGFFERKENLPRAIGLGSLGMGGLTLAAVLDYLLLGPEPAGHLFLYVVVVSLAINDIIALQYLGKILIKKTV